MADNPLDRWFGAVKTHHVFNAVTLIALFALVWVVPTLTLLPLWLAAVARVPFLSLQKRYGFSAGGAATTVIFTAALIVVATTVAVVLPIVLQLLRLESGQLAELKPYAQDFVAWAKDGLIALGVDAQTLETTLGLTYEKLGTMVTEKLDEALKLLFSASGLALKPVIFLGLVVLIVFLAAYALAYSDTLRAEIRRFMRLGWPEKTVRLVERTTVHAQELGAEVFRGYGFMVLVIGFFYFAVYLGALSLFPAARALPPLAVVVLLALSGLIGAIPGLGAKVLLLVGAVVGAIVGALASVVTGSFWIGVYIFAAVVIVTGFESKFGTPRTLGRALGVNSCLILYLAIAVVVGYGIGAVLWSVFVFLPIAAAATRIMAEEYGEPSPFKPEQGAPVPALEDARD